MTDNNHPITPSPELVQQWVNDYSCHPRPVCSRAIAIQAARWGADQELEACVEWVSQWCGRWPDGTRPEDELCAARRPKPPSLKERIATAIAHGDNSIALALLDQALPD